MKRLVVCLLALLVMSSCRTTTDASAAKDGEVAPAERNIKQVTCRDASGDRKLFVERSINELPFPTYNIRLEYRGEVFTDVGDAGVERNTQSSFLVSKVTTIDDRENIQVSAGFNWRAGQALGFYMEAANGGASPMPGVEFSSCVVKEFGDQSDTVNQQNIKKLDCADPTGDRVLLVERSINELPFPTYHVKLRFRGQVFTNVADAPVERNTPQSFMVQKVATVDDRENIQVSAGANWSDAGINGFYMEAANGGTSPLPGSEFGECNVTYFD